MPSQQLALPHGTRKRIRAPGLRRAGIEHAIALLLLGAPQARHLRPVRPRHLAQEAQQGEAGFLRQLQGDGHELLGEGGDAQRRDGAEAVGRQEHGGEAAQEEHGGCLDVDFVAGRRWG